MVKNDLLLSENMESSHDLGSKRPSYVSYYIALSTVSYAHQAVLDNDDITVS